MIGKVRGGGEEEGVLDASGSSSHDDQCLNIL